MTTENATPLVGFTKALAELKGKPENRPVKLDAEDVIEVVGDNAGDACQYLKKAAEKTGAPEICPPLGIVRDALQELASPKKQDPPKK